MVYDTYSKRTKNVKRLQMEQYNEIPEPLGNQIVSILEQIVGPSGWEELWHDFCDEKGKHRDEKIISIHRDSYIDPDILEEVLENIRTEYQIRCCSQIEKGTLEDAFDLIDVAFQMTHQIIRGGQISTKERQDRKAVYKQAVEDINIRFEENSTGYRLLDNRIERNIFSLDVTLPALGSLRSDGFGGANEEFLSACQSYQDGKYRHCITDANAAFESVMKVICDQRGWNYGRGTANNLVKTLSDNKLVPSYLHSHFQQFLSILKSGLPPMRHEKSSSHGQGKKPIKVPAYMAEYALHLATANILFLIQAAKSQNELAETENAK